jgi:hypothetical protein
VAIEVKMPSVTGFGDGDYVGANGQGGRVSPGSFSGYHPSNFFWGVPGITPSISESHPAVPALNKRIVYINGINTPRSAHAYSLKLLTTVTGAVVVGIYNMSGDGTDGNIVFDLVQCLGDKSGLSNNPATKTLGLAVYNSCVSGVYLNIVAHSQGAIITSRGIRQGIGLLLDHYGRMHREVSPIIDSLEKKRGFFENVLRGIVSANDVDRIRLNLALKKYIQPIVEKKLHDYVSAQTFGGAGRFFPDGPVYRHVFNSWDPVPNLFGQGDIFTGPGRGARVEKVSRNSGSIGPDFDDHSMDGVYLQSSQYYTDRTGKKVDSNYIPIDMSMIRAN